MNVATDGSFILSLFVVFRLFLLLNSSIFSHFVSVISFGSVSRKLKTAAATKMWTIEPCVVLWVVLNALSWAIRSLTNVTMRNGMRRRDKHTKSLNPSTWKPLTMRENSDFSSALIWFTQSVCLIRIPATPPVKRFLHRDSNRWWSHTLLVFEEWKSFNDFLIGSSCCSTDLTLTNQIICQFFANHSTTKTHTYENTIPNLESFTLVVLDIELKSSSAVWAKIAGTYKCSAFLGRRAMTTVERRRERLAKQKQKVALAMIWWLT